MKRKCQMHFMIDDLAFSQLLPQTGSLENHDFRQNKCAVSQAT